jgi:hypothetical protein
LIGTLVGRKHWIEDVLYSPASDDQCQTPHKPHSVHLECRQAQRLAHSEFSVAQDLEWKVEAVGHFKLILRRLSTKAEKVGLEPQ